MGPGSPSDRRISSLAMHRVSSTDSVGFAGSLFARVSLADHLAETGQGVFFQTVLEEIAVHGLCRDRPLAGSHDHLAIGRRHATCGIEAGHTRSQTRIDDDFPFRVDPSADVLRQVSVIHVSSGREGRIEHSRIAVLEGQATKMSLYMVHQADALSANENPIFFQPSGMI